MQLFLLLRPLFLFFILLTFTWADDCALAQSCGKCTAIMNNTTAPICGWCPSTWACLPGLATGPTQGHCDNWIYGPNCPDCVVQSSCISCAKVPNCGWNDAATVCTDINTLGASKSCPCTSLLQCTDCASTPDCVYCANMGRCVANSTRPPACAAQSFCDCSSWDGSCALCSAQSDICAYCAATSRCMPVLTNGCPAPLMRICQLQPPAPPPPPPPPAGNAGSFVGGFFSGLGVLAAVVIVAYVVYRCRGGRLGYAQV